MRTKRRVRRGCRVNLLMLALLTAAALPPSYGRGQDGPLEQLQQVQAALDRHPSIEKLSRSDRLSYWEIRFFRGDAGRFNAFLAGLSTATTSGGSFELVLHPENGRSFLEAALKQSAKLTKKEIANLAQVVGDGEHTFSMGRFIDPPLPVAGKPFDFDWCVDVRQAYGPGIPPPEFARPRVTVHLFTKGRTSLAKVEVPQNVKMTSGGAIGHFIWRVEAERAYGKDKVDAILGRP